MDDFEALAVFLGMFMILIYLAIYLVPTIVAICRRAHYMTAAIIINIFLGWTFIGWIIALVLACLNAPAPAQPIVVQQQVVNDRRISNNSGRANNRPRKKRPNSQQSRRAA